jgi:beta-lactamase regulating signal transducer with metallopeptidase domain
MEQAWIEYILNALWQLPLLAAGAWLLLLALQAEPATQHRIWLAVLALAVLLPARGIRVHPGASLEAQRTDVNTRSPMPLPKQESGVLLPEIEPAATRRPPTDRVSHVHFTPVIAHVVAGFFLCLVLLSFVRVALAWRLAMQLVQQASPATLSAAHMETLQSCSRHLGVKAPQVRESGALSSPVLVGAFSPVLLLPLGFDHHTPERMTAAFCHELAHLRRHDYLVNLACQLVGLPVNWHPITHLVQRQIRRSCEMTCDAMAARQMCSEIGYAKCLLALAQSMVTGETAARYGQALGMFDNNVLEERVMRLVEKKSVMSLRAKLARVAAGATGLIATIVVAAVFHIAPVMAQQSDGAQPQTQSVLPQQDVTPAATTEPTPALQKTPHIHRPQIKVDANGGQSEVTPETKAQIQQQMEDALRQLREVHTELNSPEFKRQIEEATRNDSKLALQSDELKKQIAEAQKQFRSEEFKKQMAELQQQIKNGQLKQMKNGELQQQMEQLQKQLQSDALKKQMADMQSQINSGELKQEMEKVQKQLQSGDFQKQMEQAAQALKDAQEQLKKEHLQ